MFWFKNPGRRMSDRFQRFSKHAWMSTFLRISPIESMLSVFWFRIPDSFSPAVLTKRTGNGIRFSVYVNRFLIPGSFFGFFLKDFHSCLYLYQKINRKIVWKDFVFIWNLKKAKNSEIEFKCSNNLPSVFNIISKQGLYMSAHIQNVCMFFQSLMNVYFQPDAPQSLDL
jgi:hypothetical protein